MLQIASGLYESTRLLRRETYDWSLEQTDSGTTNTKQQVTEKLAQNLSLFRMCRIKERNPKEQANEEMMKEIKRNKRKKCDI